MDARATICTLHHTSLLHYCYMLVVTAAEECCWAHDPCADHPPLQGNAANHKAQDQCMRKLKNCCGTRPCRLPPPTAKISSP